MPPPADIWIPPSARPKWRCDLCGEQFYENESVSRVRHVTRCAAEHHQELVDHIEQVEPSAFFKPLDAEYSRWVRTGGAPGGQTEHV